jgi:hypothetical protein
MDLREIFIRRIALSKSILFFNYQHVKWPALEAVSDRIWPRKGLILKTNIK